MQYFWCEKYGAHTRQRVRALKEPCKHKMGNSNAAARLTLGLHPYTGAPLGSATRRLTLEDVGYVPHTDEQIYVGDALSPLEVLPWRPFDDADG